MAKAQDDSKTIPAVKMKSGEEGIISELDTDSKSILRKLMAMGILPGMKLKMIQTFPSYVFQVGYTQVAVDKEIASVILISKE